MGTLIQKIQFQDTPSTMAPPTRGPMAMARPTHCTPGPSATPRRSAATAADNRVRVSGVTMAAPMPWAMRPMSSISTLVDMAAKAEAAVKMATPMTNMRRRPKRSPSAAPVSRKHCEGQRVGVDGPLELLDGGPELLADDVESGRHDEVVEHDHDQRHRRHRERPDGQ